MTARRALSRSQSAVTASEPTMAASSISSGVGFSTGSLARSSGSIIRKRPTLVTSHEAIGARKTRSVNPYSTACRGAHQKDAPWATSKFSQRFQRLPALVDAALIGGV